MAGLAHLGVEAGHQLLEIGAQLEVAMLFAGLVGGHLLEALDQLRGALDVVAQQISAFPGEVHVTLQVGTLHAVFGEQCGKLDCSLAEVRRRGQRHADRCVDFVCHTRHQLAECGHLLGMHQLVACLLHVLQRRAQLVGGALYLLDQRFLDRQRLLEQVRLHLQQHVHVDDAERIAKIDEHRVVGALARARQRCPGGGGHPHGTRHHQRFGVHGGEQLIDRPLDVDIPAHRLAELGHQAFARQNADQPPLIADDAARQVRVGHESLLDLAGARADIETRLRRAQVGQRRRRQLRFHGRAGGRCHGRVAHASMSRPMLALPQNSWISRWSTGSSWRVVSMYSTVVRFMREWK